MSQIERAIADLKSGKFVLIYDADDREGETDLVISSQFATKDAIQMLRADGGGLVCTTVHESTYEKVGLPFLTEIHSYAEKKFPILKALEPSDIPYDAKSAFSVTINHRKTFTGITDIDRALTITEFAKFAAMVPTMKEADAAKEFGMQFRSPGHVHLLNAAKGLLDSRKGHTELTTALMLFAGLTPSATICEMMADDGKARSSAEAVKYAGRNDLVILDGKQVLGEWKRRKRNG